MFRCPEKGHGNQGISGGGKKDGEAERGKAGRSVGSIDALCFF